MNGFGFIQYDNEDDPKDIVPGESNTLKSPLVGIVCVYGWIILLTTLCARV